MALIREEDSAKSLELECTAGSAQSPQRFSRSNAFFIRWPLQENRDLECIDADYHGYMGYASILHKAAHNGLMDVVIEQAAAKCDLNCKDNEGRTPMHYAARGGNLKVVRYLIEEQGCDPMTKDDLDYTPLHFACLNRYAHVVQYLLSTGRVDPQANALLCTTSTQMHDSKLLVYYAQ